MCRHDWKGFHLGHKLAITDPYAGTLLDGLYTIRAQDGPDNPVQDRYLSCGASASNTYVDLWHCDDGSGRQQWGLESVNLNGNMVYRIYNERGRPQDARRYLSCQRGPADNGKVDLWFDDDGSGRQLWWVVPCGSANSNCVYIYPAGGREGKMLLSRKESGSLVDLWWAAGHYQVSHIYCQGRNA